MALHVPFTQQRYQVEDTLIPGNSTDPNPVVFHLSPAQGPDRARLRSILFATGTLSDDLQEWDQRTQDAVIASYGRGGQLFIATIDKVEGLTIPGAMAKKTLLVPSDKWDEVPDDATIPIRSGTDFGMVSGYLLALSFSVAMEILKISKLLDNMDRRLFDLPSGSPSPEKPQPTPGTVGRVKRQRSGRRATAG